MGRAGAQVHTRTGRRTHARAQGASSTTVALAKPRWAKTARGAVTPDVPDVARSRQKVSVTQSQSKVVKCLNNCVTNDTKKLIDIVPYCL